MSKSENRSVPFILILLGLLLIFAFFLDDPKPKKPKQIAQQKTNAQGPYEKINREMQNTEGQMELNSLTREIENSEFAAPVRNVVNELRSMPKIYSPYDTEDVAGRVYKDLERKENFETPHLPEDRINALIDKHLWLNKYDQTQKEEFIRAVILNARAAGYELQINEDLLIISARAINKENTPLKFPLREPSQSPSGLPSGSQ